MRITITSGSLSAALGFAGTGVAWMLPEQKWLGAIFVIFALVSFAIDVRIERGQIQTKGRKISPILLILSGIIIILSGFIWQLYRYVSKSIAVENADSALNIYNDTSKNSLTFAFDFPKRSQLGSGFTSLNLYFTNRLDKDVIIRQIYLKQFIANIPKYNGRQKFDHLCKQEEYLGPGDLSEVSDHSAFKVGENILAYDILPSEFRLDGTAREPIVFVIPSNRSAVVFASFRTHKIDNEQNFTILCPKIQYIREDGSRRTLNNKGSFVGLTDSEDGLPGGKIVGPTPGPVSVYR